MYHFLNPVIDKRLCDLDSNEVPDLDTYLSLTPFSTFVKSETNFLQ